MAATVARAARGSLALFRPVLGSAGDGRRGVRALRRSPVRVHPPLAQAQQRVVPGPAQAQPGLNHKKPRDPPDFERKRAREEEPQEVELRYERAGSGDKRLSKVVTIAKSRVFREKHGKILLEGKRLITDALEAGAVPQTLFFSTQDQLKELPVAKLKGANLVKVKFEEIKTWSDVIAPQGVIGIFFRPDHAKMVYPEVQQKHTLPLSLICDNIRDPGNLGTILRSAAGAGCSRVLLVKGCVDAWEPKVLRAGMGAHFRLPILTSLEWEVIPNYLSTETCVYVADSTGADAQVEAELASPSKASSHGWVSRPYNLKALQLAQSDWDPASDSKEERETGPLEAQHYYEHWMDAPVAVVIGGETHGVSDEAMELAENTGGKRLLIPVVPGVDSLNSAMAASILLFEGKRQLHQMEQS
ncbi:rRNA methyltransferase 3, mitochondrial [Tiliqua scincoides]|uniref:rRNA methyltransferase 3, mitochondrial n=1 Tax=Tiliqua scincoides TaxID=71010 RepID=UPI003461C82A